MWKTWPSWGEDDEESCQPQTYRGGAPGWVTALLLLAAAFDGRATGQGISDSESPSAEQPSESQIATTSAIPPAASTGRHPVPETHPRLFGSRERLQQLARERAAAYRRMVSVAREQEADPWAKLVSMGLVSAIERDAPLGRRAVEMALRTVDGPIRQGHVTFGHDLAPVP